MSEPLSTDEIEDVVSSVRRLLSPEVRPRPVSRDLGQDRLLLTPALQVVAEPEALDPEALEPEAVEPEAVEPKPADLLMLNVRALEPEGPAETVRPEVMAEADAEADVEVASAPADIFPKPEASAEFLHVVESEWEDAFWSEPEPALAELALGAEEAELVQAEDVILAEAEGNSTAWSQEPVPFVAIHHRNAAAAEVKGRSTEPLAAVKPSPEAVAPEESVPANSGAESDATETVGSEAEVSETHGAAAMYATDEAADHALDLTEADDAGIAHAPSGLAATGMTEVLTDKDGNPVTVLDEDALSQIVRLLIREELQGVLGERITQNVRKLVRAEINRALTAQSLD